ncbi:hypothetical protein ACIQ6Y_21885 [Streptomyces sp. NPDC096205]|uniref:hypothetical protein n=1 Tax=Streptomyces sp. NPDC096205 TaxID=3366081 RepID=UPI0037F39162
MYLDLGSGGEIHETREWWAYDGFMNRPTAAAYRAACACGWRGPGHPVPSAEPAGRPSDLDVSAAHADWCEHLRDVQRRTVPLPADVTELLDRLETRLCSLAEEAPLAALRAVARLERLTRDAGRDAAYVIDDEALSPETVGEALGIDAAKAHSRVLRHLRFD